MKSYNAIWIFNHAADRVLMCRRQKEPYFGLYNLVGGKVEPGEDSMAAAVRELREETGLDGIPLIRLMDFTYYLEGACRVEVYVGKMADAAQVYGEENPLEWLELTENFFDMRRFAGEGNIGHIYEIIRENIGSFL